MRTQGSYGRYTISEQIFKRFPGYVRGVVIADGVVNSTTPPALTEQMRAAEEDLRARVSLDHIAEHPRIRAWREAYRSFGARPSEFRSSIEALARRVLRGEPLPAINALVDIGNLVSIRYLLPAGGHAIDVLTGDIALRLAEGDESFTPFGSEVEEHPLPGEIIFAEGSTVLTRRWTWRQASHTLTRLDTRAIEFNVDGLPPVPATEVEQACAEIAGLAARFCGGRTRTCLLSEQNPSVILTV